MAKSLFHWRPLRRCGRAAQASLIALASASAVPVAAQTIPTNPSPTCTVSPTNFASWFQSTPPTVNGVVNPANSVAFPNTPNCSFYQWSEQMFLWLTSPAPSSYGGGDRIFDSPTFYDVSPPDASGNRTLLPRTSGFLHVFGVRATQGGPHGLPVIFSKSGQLLEIEPSDSVATPQPRIHDVNENLVAIAHAERDVTGALILRDANGAVIQPHTAATQTSTRKIFRDPTPGPARVRSFIIDGLPIFIDPFGNIIEVEQGQADGSVLESQTNSLIYYGIMVNDVYAYFLTGLDDGAIQPGNPNPTFPTTLSDLNAITAFAGAHGKTLVDSDALAVEVKTSWVDASTLPNASSYITVTASVPTYNTSNPNLWTQTGAKTTTLALVGMHVVGSTAGHPEMVWASFEHFGNTPNNSFQYIDSGGNIQTVSQNTSGAWMFSKTGSTGPFDQTHMTQSGANIQAAGSFAISASDTLRQKAWGAASDIPNNPIDGSAAASNTELVSINNSVRGMLPSSDVRGNYFLLGATWTIFGAAPTPQFCFGNNNPPGCTSTGAPTLAEPGNQVGTSHLANSTMETYQQGSDTTSNGATNCFSCHTSSTQTVATTAVSHIFGAIKPLF